MNEVKKENECRSLSKIEKEAVAKMKTHRIKCRDIFRVVDGEDKEGRQKIVPIYAKELSQYDAEDEFHAWVYASTGASSQQVGLNMLSKACEALTKSSATVEESVLTLNIVAKAMQALEPQDEIEGQLVSQLAVLHEQSMSWLGRAMKTDRVDFANTYLNGVSKLLARHHETLATLIKYRRGGEQRVHVEHVHVHNGGKAIVGNVDTGGGLSQKNEEGPHAKV